jgi:hypothetical protein
VSFSTPCKDIGSSSTALPPLWPSSPAHTWVQGLTHWPQPSWPVGRKLLDLTHLNFRFDLFSVCRRN